MTLVDRIDADLKAALKVQDKLRLDTLRAVKTAFKNKSVELIRPLTETESVQIITTLVKQRRESVDQFKAGGRLDLARQEEKEIAVLAVYLPPAMSEEELANIVKAVISELGATSKKDMGRVMKVVIERVAGRADGKLVSSLVTKLL